MDKNKETNLLSTFWNWKRLEVLDYCFAKKRNFKWSCTLENFIIFKPSYVQALVYLDFKCLNGNFT